MNTAIATTGLRKSFGDTLVLDGVDITVPTGSTFALLGPNGAGKTTMVRILSTLIKPDGGTASVAGHDVVRGAAEVRAAIGVTGQFSAVDNLLTGRENLRLMADLNHLGRAGRARIESLLERFDLADAANKAVSTYSGGMRRRLDLAMTLVGEPSVIFLDEPTTGLDPRSRRTTWDILRGLVADGVTLFLTTQYLEEADELADQVALLDHGRIVAQGTPQELKRLVPGGHVRLQFARLDQLDKASARFDDGERNDDDLSLDVPADGDLRSLRVLLDRLDRDGIEVDDLTIHAPDLDDVFLALTHERKAV